MEDALRAKEERCTFLETQLKRTLDDKAELDAKHRAEAADVRKQKAEAIKERDDWKARFEQAQKADGREREFELMRNRVRDTLAEIKLKEAVWERRELLAHETATFLASRHVQDVALAEVQRKMAAQKEKTARERELLLEDEVHSLRAANKTLLTAADRQGRMSNVRELQAMAAQNQELRQRLSVADMNTHAYKAENDRLTTVVRQAEALHHDLQRRTAEAEAAHNKLHVEWVTQQQDFEQTRKAAAKLRSELMAARGEKQLLERSLGEVKSKAARTVEKRKEDGRTNKSQATTVASQEAVIARLCEQIATLSGRAVEPDLSALPTTGQSKRARTESVIDVSSARISTVLSPLTQPSLPALGKQPATRKQPADSDDDDDDDDDEPYTFGSTYKRTKRTVSGSSKASTDSAASTSTMTSTADASMNGSLSPLSPSSSKESTPRPRTATPSAEPGLSNPVARPTAGRRPASLQEAKTSPAQSHPSTLNLQSLELSDSDDEIVVTGETIVTPRSPIKRLPRVASRGPVRPPPPFPMTFSQFPSFQRSQQS